MERTGAYGRPGGGATPPEPDQIRNRALAPAQAAEEAAAVPGRSPSPGSPSRPRRSALPEAAEAGAAEAVVEVPAEPRAGRTCT